MWGAGAEFYILCHCQEQLTETAISGTCEPASPDNQSGLSNFTGGVAYANLQTLQRGPGEEPIAAARREGQAEEDVVDTASAKPMGGSSTHHWDPTNELEQVAQEADTTG